MAPLNKNLKDKRRLPKMNTQTLLDFDLGESSSDSDFRIEDHVHDTDEFSVSSKESAGDGVDDDDDNDEEDDSNSDISDKETATAVEKVGTTSSPIKENSSIRDIISKAIEGENMVSHLKIDITKNLICCACLGDRSDDSNEIVECDGCGASVHEGCYGINDTASISSTNSSCSTEPWFCEACKAGVLEPSCELCPAKGGIFKETEVGRWVHLICALYVPGVAFGEVDILSSVTLFEMQYNKWGAKQCSLCEDDRYARTGVCIGCDAGMCKNFFHVTCAQAAGFLSEPHCDEADHADPFYAHCKVHSDKTMIKHRKRNYNLLKLRTQQIKFQKVEQSKEKQTSGQLRIQRKLIKHQKRYKNHKETKNEPWVPTQKIPRLLTTSATAVRRLQAKATVMGIDTELLEFQEAQLAAIRDIRKKWHIPPAFTVEYTAYFFDRISRTKELKAGLEKKLENNNKLLIDQTSYREQYDKLINNNTELLEKYMKLKSYVEAFHKGLSFICPGKHLQPIDNVECNVQYQQTQLVEHSTETPSITASAVVIPRTMSVPTAAARKMGVGFPLNNLPGDKKGDTNRILSTQINKNQLVNNCGICKGCHDQHLLAKCDTCHLYYHLGCLNPPLTRHPKKSKLYGWQCSECDKSDDSDVVVELPPGPRRSRTKFSKDGKIVPVDGNSSLNSNSIEEDNIGNVLEKSIDQPIKRKSIDRRTSISQPLAANTSTPNIVEMNVLYNGQTKDNSPPKSPTKFNKKQFKKTNRNSTSPSKITNNSLNENIDDISLRNQSIYFDSESQNKWENSKKKLNKHSIISETSPPLSTTSGVITKSRPSSTLGTPIKNISDPLCLNNSPLIENIIIKSTRNLKRKRDSEEVIDIDPLKISPNKLNCTVNLQLMNNSEAILINKNDNEEGDSGHKTNKILELGDNSDIIIHKQNRKKRKDKHKNKYSDNDKSPSKEHKRKRKKKSHDMENPKDLSSLSSATVPKIKIKFKTLPLPGETAPEPQFFYVSADMVRATDASSRPTSVETVEDMATTINNDNETITTNNISAPSTSARLNSPVNSDGSISPTKRKPKPINRDIPKPITAIAKQSTEPSPKRVKLSRMSTNSNMSISNASGSSQLLTSTCSLNCTICQLIGTIQNSVQCDECHGVYHYTCLDPPVKKNPKRRGYSWHCADCDPTDYEFL